MKEEDTQPSAKGISGPDVSNLREYTESNLAGFLLQWFVFPMFTFSELKGGKNLVSEVQDSAENECQEKKLDLLGF